MRSCNHQVFNYKDAFASQRKIDQSLTKRRLTPAAGHSSRGGAARRHGIGAVRVAFPSDSSVTLHPDELVLEALSRRKSQGCSPQGVGARVRRGRKRLGVCDVPAAELGDGADDLDVLSVVGADGLLERDGDVSGGA